MDFSFLWDPLYLFRVVFLRFILQRMNVFNYLVSNQDIFDVPSLHLDIFS